MNKFESQSTYNVDELIRKLSVSDMERILSLKSNFEKEDLRSIIKKKTMNDSEIDALINELDRGVTNVLESQLVKIKTSL